MELIWLVGGFILLFMEFFLPSFEIFFFAIGALITGLLTWLVPGLSGSVGLQIGLWLGSSVLTLGLLRKRFASWFKGKQIGDGSEVIEDSGVTATVRKAITPDSPGRITIHGTTWEARSFDETFQPGDSVAILKKEGMVYYVTRTLLPDNTGEDPDFSELTRNNPE